jgi:hypothetical protein
VQRVLTLISASIAAACGAVLAILFTVAHRATVAMLGIDVPYGIAAGLVSIIAFLIAMRLLWDTRWPAIGAAIGVVGAVGILTFVGVGGTVIVGNDAFGWTWLVTSVLVSAVIVAWPRRRPRRAAPAPSEPEAGVPTGTIDEPLPLGRASAEEGL